MASSGTGGGGGGAGGMSLASAGLSAYSTILQSQGTANTDNWQAEKLQTAATYGDLKAVQAGGQMTRNLNSTLGNIDAVRAAAGADPNSPTGAAFRQNQEMIGTENKNITVDSILAQSNPNSIRAQEIERRPNAPKKSSSSLDMAVKPQVNENTLRAMQALLRQPPKPRDEMKLQKLRGKKAASPKRPLPLQLPLSAMRVFRALAWSASLTRCMAGCAGFLTFSQFGDVPAR